MKAFGGRGMWSPFLALAPRVDLERGRPADVEGMDCRPSSVVGDDGEFEEVVAMGSVVEVLEEEGMVIVDGITWEEPMFAREGEAVSSRNV